MNKFRDWLAVACRQLPVSLLIVGAALRLIGTGAAAIWYDEATTWYRASIPFLTLYSDHSEASGDLLLELLVRPLMAISQSLWMLRLPSMLAGFASLWLVWKLMRRLDFTLPQRIITAAVVACLPGLLWMAQDARSYSLLSLLFLAALWFAIEGRWLGLAAVSGLMIYAHSTGPVWAVAPLLIALYLRPAELRRFLLAGAGIALAWIPAAVHMLDAWQVIQPWQPYLTVNWLMYSTLQSFWPLRWDTWFTLAVLLLAALTVIRLAGTLLLMLIKKPGSGPIVLLAAWLLPYLGMVAFCVVTRSNILNYRTLMPMLFPFAIWLGRELGRRQMSSYLHLAVWTLMLLAGLMLWDAADRGGHLDRVAAQIRAQWRPGDALVYTTATVSLPFEYYLGDLPHTWDGTIGSPHLAIPAIPRTGDLDYQPARLWVIVPRETTLITQAEQSALDDLVHHQAPTYSVEYIQTAEINVYLVEDKP